MCASWENLKFGWLFWLFSEKLESKTMRSCVNYIKCISGLNLTVTCQLESKVSLELYVSSIKSFFGAYWHLFDYFVSEGNSLWRFTGIPFFMKVFPLKSIAAFSVMSESWKLFSPSHGIPKELHWTIAFVGMCSLIQVQKNLKTNLTKNLHLIITECVFSYNVTQLELTTFM